MNEYLSGREGSFVVFDSLAGEIMSNSLEPREKIKIDRVADESGLAVSIIDASGEEISTSNNNSICNTLNPDRVFSKECESYCGAAYEKATSSDLVIQYRCHAGLECRAVSFRTGHSPLVAIVGRTFTNADEYRKATERAISGDWAHHSPNEFFENVLMSRSPNDLEQAVRELQAIAIEESANPKGESKPDELTNTAIDERHSNNDDGAQKDDTTTAETEGLPSRTRGSEVTEWRSFFGSLLRLDYAEASAATLRFVSEQFGLGSLIWLKRNGNRLENSAEFGKMKDRRVRLGLAADDKRLVKALADGKPLELAERPKGAGADHIRKMTLFPIGIAGEVSAAIAVLDPIVNETHKDQIVRICRSMAQQLEILRLRSEVARGDSVSNAVRRFSESLKRLDNEDLWISLTQNAAEMLKAERSSLLVFDEESGHFQVKAILGTDLSLAGDQAIGERIARHVYTTKRAIAVADISKAGLWPGTQDRHYKTPSFLSSPISVGGRVIGVMNFADRACGESFDKAALDLFEAIAPQLAVAIDRAKLKEIAGQFEQLSVTDALTGLLNRRYMVERLMEETKRSNRHGYPMSFMMLDVDEFKSYNDNFGHPAGDEALKLVGNVMRETLRGADVASRFGGEEFAILLPQTTSDEARMIAERIRANIEQTKFPHRTVTISIGVASCSAELCRDADLISAADKALYRAKRGGRNRVLAFEDKTGQETGPKE
jgi:diguanylate cyclase (GGDEF)-like protein